MRLRASSLSFSLVLLLVCACTSHSTPSAESVPVTVLVVAADSSAYSETYSGTLEATTATALSFGSAGTLATLPAREGQMVAVGQVLATLDGTTQENLLLSAQAAYAAALSALHQAEDAYTRMSQLREAGSLADMQWIDVETKLRQAQATEQGAAAQVTLAEKGVADTRLTAPYSGFIAQRNADVGQQVAPGIPIVTVVAIDKVKAKISVPEGERHMFAVGDTLTVSVAASSAGVYTGRVSECAVSADALSRSYSVWVEVDNSAHTLLPGMLCTVTCSRPSSSPTVAIPAQDILIDYANRRYVWAVRGGRARRQYLTTGANVGSNVVVLSGLAIGDSIISAGRQKVWEGMAL